MSRFSVSRTLDSVAARQDRNVANIGLMPLAITLLAAVGWIGWLNSEAPAGASIQSVLKVPVLLVLCGLPLILFVLAGPLERSSKMSEQGLRGAVAFVVLFVSGFALAALAVLPYPLWEVQTVNELRSMAHLEFAMDASPVQLWSGAALTVIGLWFVMYEFAQRGSALRDPDHFQTHFKGLRWVPGAVAATRHYVWLFLVFVFRTLPVGAYHLIVNMRNARKNYEGALDTEESVSSGGLKDLMDGRVGRQDAPLENPAEHHRSVPEPEPRREAPEFRPQPVSMPAMATTIPTSRPATVPAGGSSVPPWARDVDES